jgi:hypothetical protein
MAILDLISRKFYKYHTAILQIHKLADL